MTFEGRNLERLNQILVDAARREIMPRFRNLAAGEIRQKGSSVDLVTEADEAAERFIFAKLAKAFPGAALVGEELVATNPSALETLSGAELAIVVDPIDGTLNYASDLPLFVVMAAAIMKGEIVAAVIHDPIVEDFALALRGEGAWLELRDGGSRQLHVAQAAEIAQMSGMASWQYFDEPLRSMLPGRFPKFQAVNSMRCCGHEYRLAAGGYCHFLLYGRLNPWDHAAGVLLCEEAGGYVRMLDGGSYQVRERPSGLLCAPDASSWEKIKSHLVE